MDDTTSAGTALSIWSLLMVFMLQCLGAFEHWRMMKKDGRVTGNFFGDYMFASYPGRSALTIFLIAATSWMAALGGAADYLNPELLWSLVSTGMIDTKLAASITGAVTTSFLAGYGFDSRFNKGSDPVTESPAEPAAGAS